MISTRTGAESIINYPPPSIRSRSNKKKKKKKSRILISTKLGLGTTGRGGCSSFSCKKSLGMRIYKSPDHKINGNPLFRNHLQKKDKRCCWYKWLSFFYTRIGFEYMSFHQCVYIAVLQMVHIEYKYHIKRNVALIIWDVYP